MTTYGAHIGVAANEKHDLQRLRARLVDLARGDGFVIVGDIAVEWFQFGADEARVDDGYVLGASEAPSWGLREGDWLARCTVEIDVTDRVRP